jgi:hypothetical protein
LRAGAAGKQGAERQEANNGISPYFLHFGLLVVAV